MKKDKLRTLAVYVTGYALLTAVAIMSFGKGNYVEGILSLGAVVAISWGTDEIIASFRGGKP